MDRKNSEITAMLINEELEFNEATKFMNLVSMGTCNNTAEAEIKAQLTTGNTCNFLL